MNLINIFFLFFLKFPVLYSSYFLIYSFNWYGNFLNIEYNIGLDYLGLIFILLTIFLIPISLIISWKSIYYNTKSFFLLFIILELLLINVFSAIDLVLFYIAFESILIPMYFLIGYWGSRERRMHAAYQFFLFTLGGSLFMLILLIFFQLNLGSTNLHFLLNTFFSPYRELFIWLGIFITFAVKIPLMPLHIWLPEAHVESATGGSVALAGILLKLGTYGILRFLIPLFNFSSIFFIPFVYLISLFGIFYASLTTLRQIDLKKIIAYSSVIHMNYLMFGLFAFNLEGLVGSLILMIAHGFVSGGLFVCIGLLYERYHTRLKKPYGGLNYFMPIFSFLFLVFTLANISFPGSINFIGEFLVLLGMFMKNLILSFVVIFLMILSTCYSLWLYNKIFSGLILQNSFNLNLYVCGILFRKLNLNRIFLINYTDLNLREFSSLIYLIIPVIYLGFNPSLLIFFLEMDFSTILVL
jgi:proton-translocating NADH-quinone oxidoreductase chain M